MSGYKYASLVPDNELAAAIDGAAVTPNDTVDLPYTARALYIGATGDLTVTMREGAQLTFKNMPVGFAQLSVSRVWATGTGANMHILALF